MLEISPFEKKNNLCIDPCQTKKGVVDLGVGLGVDLSVDLGVDLGVDLTCLRSRSQDICKDSEFLKHHLLKT